MESVEKRSGHYRDPLGRQRSKTFARKADADPYRRKVQVEMVRGRWLDPHGAEMPLASWAEEFLSLSRRLSPLTQETNRRDITKYVLPRFGAYPSAAFPPTRSRTGSTTRWRPGSPRARCPPLLDVAPDAAGGG